MNNTTTDNQHVRYYYLRNDFDNPIGCVCLIRTEENVFHRGISLCNYSHGDKFVKATARRIAYGRALKAKDIVENDRITNLPLDANFIVALSDDMIEKLGYISEKYNLGSKARKVLPNVLPMSNGNAVLTSGEKEMWKDHLDPNFVHGKFKKDK